MKRSENKAITQRTAHGTGVHVYDNFAPSEPETRPPPASRLPSWVVGTVESELIGCEWVYVRLLGFWCSTHGQSSFAHPPTHREREATT